MGLDIRIPIGLMFQILGLLLLVYGGMTNGASVYAQKSLGMNINLWWGGVLLVFGTVMFLLGRRGGEKG